MTDADIEAAIYALLGRRRADASICPSDVARELSPDDEDAWRASMPAVRRVAAALAASGRLVVTRGRDTVDATAPGGPIRLRLPRS